MDRTTADIERFMREDFRRLDEVAQTKLPGLLDTFGQESHEDRKAARRPQPSSSIEDGSTAVGRSRTLKASTFSALTSTRGAKNHVVTPCESTNAAAPGLLAIGDDLDDGSILRGRPDLAPEGVTDHIPVNLLAATQALLDQRQLVGKVLGRCALARGKKVRPALLLHQSAVRDRAANAPVDGVLRHVRADEEDLLEKHGLVHAEAFEQIFRKGFQNSF